jgi:hypothetical protein
MAHALHASILQEIANTLEWVVSKLIVENLRTRCSAQSNELVLVRTQDYSLFLRVESNRLINDRLNIDRKSLEEFDVGRERFSFSQAP